MNIKEEFEKYMRGEEGRVESNELGTKIIESDDCKIRTNSLVYSTVKRHGFLKEFDEIWKKRKFKNRRNYFQYLIEKHLPLFVENDYIPDPDYSLGAQLAEYLSTKYNFKVSDFLTLVVKGYRK